MPDAVFNEVLTKALTPPGIRVLAIDPGPTESACVVWDGYKILFAGDLENCDLISRLSYGRLFDADFDHLAIELVRGFGIMASDGLFDTCIVTGRFLQAFGESRTTLIGRKEVAKHICGTSGISHDKFIREALITRFGAPGTKNAPGLLYGITSHRWAALALALTWWETKRI